MISIRVTHICNNITEVIMPFLVYQIRGASYHSDANLDHLVKVVTISSSSNYKVAVCL